MNKLQNCIEKLNHEDKLWIKYFKKGKVRTEEGGVVISERYIAPIKNQGGITEHLYHLTPIIGRIVRLSYAIFYHNSHD